VIAAVRDNGGDLKQTADYLELTLGLVQAAVSYYAAYRGEIDEWIELNEREAADAHARWQAAQDAVRR
jgi:predicted transcriptional regulator